MKKSTMWTAGLAAAALAFGAPAARADDTAKAKADAQEKVEKTRADAQQNVDKTKADAKNDVQKAEAKANEKVSDAQKDANQKVEKAQEKDERHANRDTTTDTSGSTAASGGMVGSSETTHNDMNANRKHHSVFDSKDNWNVKGKVAKVSGNAVTLHRDDGPDVTLHTSSQTKIEVDGNHARASQLKPGQDVRASFNLQGASPMAVDIKADSNKSSK